MDRMGRDDIAGRYRTSVRFSDEKLEAFYRFKQGRWGRMDFTYDGGTMRNSVEYGHLHMTPFDRRIGIVLETPMYQIRIEGRNLDKLYDAILDKSVGQVIEGHLPEDQVAADDTYISRIVFDRVAPNFWGRA